MRRPSVTSQLLSTKKRLTPPLSHSPIRLISISPPDSSVASLMSFHFLPNPKLHQTGFVYTVSRVDSTRPFGGLAIQVNRTLSVADLRLDKYFFGGSDAN